jgi:hypothetical protein
MGVFGGIMVARNVTGYLETLVFRPNKTIAVVPKTGTSALAGELVDGDKVDADVIFKYGYNTSIRLTENPVEDGVIINDHRIIQPQILTIEVGFNNIVGYADVLTNLDVGTLIQAGKLLIFGNRFDAESRVSAKYTDLLQAMYNGEPFDLITPLGVFSDMLITDIESDQDGDTISAFRGTITYQKLIKYIVKKSGSLSAVAGATEPLKTGFKVPERLDNTAGRLIPTGLVF